MIKFHNLKTNQVALVRSQIKTGRVLDEKLELVSGDEQDLYSIFESYEHALEYAEQIIKMNKEVEVTIYSKESKVIYCSNP